MDIAVTGRRQVSKVRTYNKVLPTYDRFVPTQNGDLPTNNRDLPTYDRVLPDLFDAVLDRGVLDDIRLRGRDHQVSNHHQAYTAVLHAL